MTNGKLQEFVANVSARGRITFGDVRRLQRRHLPGGIATPEDLEMLISLNADLVRADRAWAEWLVAAVANFAARYDQCERSIADAAAKWLEHLLASSASATSLGRRIARQVRRELARLRAEQLRVRGSVLGQSGVDDPADCSPPNGGEADSPCCRSADEPEYSNVGDVVPVGWCDYARRLPRANKPEIEDPRFAQQVELAA